MLSSSRFVVAIHVLSILARNFGKGPVCSAHIAESVETNPVVIRRLMSELEKAKLILSTAGRCGGFSLSRPAAEVTLADIYDAVEDATIFKMHRIDAETKCPIAAQMFAVLAPRLRDAEAALSSSLHHTKLSEVALAIH